MKTKTDQKTTTAVTTGNAIARVLAKAWYCNVTNTGMLGMRAKVQSWNYCSRMCFTVVFREVKWEMVLKNANQRNCSQVIIVRKGEGGAETKVSTTKKYCSAVT